MHKEQVSDEKPSIDLDLMNENGILSKLQFMLAEEDVPSEPPTPPEPNQFFDETDQQSLNAQPKLDYYHLALKTWPHGNPPFDSKPPLAPLTTRSSTPSFFLKPPPLSSSRSSSSRDPSPTTAFENSEVKTLRRRYEPHSKNRRYNRRPTIDEELFSRSAEDSRFVELLTQQQKYNCVDGRFFTGRCSPVSPSSPITSFPPTKKLHGSARKLSIRRLQRPRLIFDEQECHSSDEMSNIRERMHSNLKKSHSGSLPTIVADIYSSGKQLEWQNDGNVTPSNSNPLLNKSMITSTIDENGSNGDFQILRVPTLGSGDISSEHSGCSEKVNELPQSAPPLNNHNNESLFVFERRKSLIQELPTIGEDQMDEKNDTWHSANDTEQTINEDFLHKRSSSDYILEKASPTLERHRSEKLNRQQRSEMRVISGNPNFSDTDDSSGIETLKLINSQTKLNGSTSALDYPSDFNDSIGKQKTSSLVLHQDGSKTLQLVECSKSDYSELKPQQVYSEDLTDATNILPSIDLPEQGSRKARILKRKNKLKRNKSSVRPAARAAPISTAVDHIAPSLLIKNVEINENQTDELHHSSSTPNVILRSSSALPSLSRKRSGTDKKKENKKIFASLFGGSTRIKDKKERQSILQNNNHESITNKRFSMVEISTWSSRCSTNGLPDDLARLLSSANEIDHPRNGSLSNCSTIGESSWQDKKKWEDLDLWKEDALSWSAQFQNIKNLRPGDEQRLNTIYELYTTEKSHCQNIIFMQQFFQVGLLERNILSANEIRTLIPDVLDSLLDFHLNLLRRIRERIFNDPMSTVSDIVYDEFSNKNGGYRTPAIKAYTDFCMARDNSSRNYTELLARNPSFKQFCTDLESIPIVKKRGDFKAFFLLIVRRLTTYPSLFEKIIKYESNPESKIQSQHALTAVRNFALRVDHELLCQLLNRRLDQIRSMIDKNSVGRVLGQKFTYADLDSEMRKVLSIGNVHWHGLNNQSFELTMLLFDDIIVFLQNKNNSLHFFTHKDHASVLPLHATLIRQIPRSNRIMLVVAEQRTPDMYELRFNNQNEMEQWILALNKAQKTAPKFVRMAKQKLFVKGSNQTPTENDEEETEEEKYNNQLIKWQDKLDSIFLTQMNNEPKLLEYMNERMEFLDQVRNHLTSFPLRPQLNNKTVAPSVVKSRDAREMSKMKTILNSHFSDLRTFRRTQLDKLIEQAQKSRDSDLVSFFDDLHEIGHPNSGESTAFSSSSDENQPSTSERCCRPRRVQTWIKSKDETQQCDIIRRHTTVPKVCSEAGSSSAECQDTANQVDERLRKLSLHSSSKSRRAATGLIKECVALRMENDKLRSQNALQSIHLAALRNRKTAHETNEKLEFLRQKQEQVQNKELEFKRQYEKHLNELKSLKLELDQKEAELKERERQCGKENLSYDLGDLDSINSSGISRDTSFRSGAVILNSSPTIPIQTSRSNSDVSVPKHLAETKEKRAKK